jgi:6-phosphogluconate dehydrogenase
MNMENSMCDIGVIGLGVMGRNLALNIADHGYAAAGLDRDLEKAKALKTEGGDRKVKGTASMEKFVGLLRRPRAVLLLVPAGKPVDDVIVDLGGRFEKGDLVIDGGNSHFTDTNRHERELAAKHIRFLGMGVSGGEKGARFGPSLMPGGSMEAYEQVKGILEAIAAKVDGDPCVTYLGPRSAGHYVKMVHNGIEYGVMQLISETYDFMKRVAGLSNDELADVYDRWNDGELRSFLIEITGGIFRRHDDDSSNRLIDMILDAARQKGTGKWMSQDAMELQAPVPVIDAAVSQRDMSGYKQEREAAGRLLRGPTPSFSGERRAVIERVEQAFSFAMIATYAQGMAQLRAASKAYDYNLNLSDIAGIWRGGCIIRAALLDDIRAALTRQPELPNLMVDGHFAKLCNERQSAAREILKLAIDNGIPTPAHAAAVAYFDSYRAERLPANLIQAQRDNFGSHTYERIDRDGTFHSEWDRT